MRPSRRLGALGASLLFVTALSCSLLIDGEPVPLRCSLEGRQGPPACDAGLTCQNGVCRLVSGAGGAAGAGAEGGGEGGGSAPGRTGP